MSELKTFHFKVKGLEYRNPITGRRYPAREMTVSVQSNMLRFAKLQARRVVQEEQGWHQPLEIYLDGRLVE